MPLTFEPNRHRYTLDTPQGVQAKVQGVTTLIGGGIPKPALVGWATRVTAEFVDENPQEIERLRGLPDVTARGRTRSALVDRLCKVPVERRDTAAVRGTEIHALAERLIAGQEVAVQDEHLAEVEGYARFLDEWDIEPVLTEVMGGNRTDWYAGTLDLLARSPHWEGVSIVDLKTSNHVYGETALQVAAYSRFEFYLDANGTEQPMPEVTSAYVAHVTPQGTDLHPLCESPAELAEAYRQFLAAAYTTKNQRRRDAFLRDPVTPDPTNKERAS